jgi:hypothetical protein
VTIQQLGAAGSFQGPQLAVPAAAFPTFDALRAAGQITASPYNIHQGNVCMIEKNKGTLHLLMDGVEIIKHFLLRDDYFVSHLSGAFLATQLARDLILTGSLPCRVEEIDGWWIIF